MKIISVKSLLLMTAYIFTAHASDKHLLEFSQDQYFQMSTKKLEAKRDAFTEHCAKSDGCAPVCLLFSSYFGIVSLLAAREIAKHELECGPGGQLACGLGTLLCESVICAAIANSAESKTEIIRKELRKVEVALRKKSN